MNEQKRKWLEERKRGIGASEAAAVLGISPWSSPVEVWARKRGLIPEMEDNERLKMGRLFEEPIAQLYADREKVTLTGGGYQSIFHPKYPVFATPDRIVDDAVRPRGLEIKTVEPMMAHEWGEEGSDEIPLHYTTQVAVCMAVTGLPEWDLAAFFSFGDFRIYRLKRDLELENMILSRLTQFWNRYVVGDEEPALDGSEACAQYLSQKYPRNTRPLLGADEEMERMLQEFFHLDGLASEANAKTEEAKNRLKAVIGEAEGIQGVCGKATWKRTKDSEKVDWENVSRVLSAPADLIKANTSIKPGSRRFLATRTKR